MTTVSVVHSDPAILGGTPVFVDTRVPVRTLLDYLAAGDSLEEFLDHFPTVSLEQAVAVLDEATDLLVTPSRIQAGNAVEVHARDGNQPMEASL